MPVKTFISQATPIDVLELARVATVKVEEARLATLQLIASPSLQNLLHVCMKHRAAYANIVSWSFELSGHGPMEAISAFDTFSTQAIDVGVDIPGTAEDGGAGAANKYIQSILRRKNLVKRLGEEGVEGLRKGLQEDRQADAQFAMIDSKARKSDELENLFKSGPRFGEASSFANETRIAWKGHVLWQLSNQLRVVFGELLHEIGPWAESAGQHARFITNTITQTTGMTDRAALFYLLADTEGGRSRAYDDIDHAVAMLNDTVVQPLRDFDHALPKNEIPPELHNRARALIIESRPKVLEVELWADEAYRSISDDTTQLSTSITTTTTEAWNKVFSTVSEVIEPERLIGGANIDIKDRLRALHELAARDGARAARAIADQLSQEISDSQWHDSIIHTAETVYMDLEDADNQSKPECTINASIRDRLLSFAARACSDTRFPVERIPVVYSAIRTASLLLHEREVDRLGGFLEHLGGTVDARFVTLKGIARVFELRPPNDSAEMSELRDRVHQYAYKFLDPDVFDAGDCSALALQAVQTLAALGDERILDVLTLLFALRRQWVLRAVREDLERLLNGWQDQSRDDVLDSSDAVARLRKVIQDLSFSMN